MRQFNVFSPLVVVVSGETFEWVLNSAQAPSVTVKPPTGGTWPLTQTSYTVTAGTPLTATVKSNQAGVRAIFQCNPEAGNVTTQEIVVAAVDFVHVCDDVKVCPGEYFIWKNDTATTVTITPDPANPEFWPLPSQSHDVPPNGHLVLQIPATANPGPPPPSYGLVVSGGCPQTTQPKIIVGGS